MAILMKLDSFISSVVSKLLSLLEFFLFLRLLLKFLGANPLAIVVGFIYKYSDTFIAPFKFIFQNIYWNGHIIEISTIMAMIGYAIAVSILFQLLHLFSRD